MVIRSALAVSTLLLFSGCDVLGLGNTTEGEAVAFGDGSALAFLETDRSGNPQRLGVRWIASFDSLPDVASPDETYEQLVPMPEGVEALLPIEHISLDWHPEGRRPVDVYGAAHIDATFYLLTEDERDEITPGDCQGTMLSCDALDRALTPVPTGAVAPGYASVGAVLPNVGNQLYDLTSDEFMGGLFDLAWVYGAWDGDIAFLEALVTQARLEVLDGEDCRPIPTPEAFTASGWYPTVYCASYDARNGSYTIALEGFTRFTTANAL